jgi:hypothetical protein
LLGSDFTFVLETGELIGDDEEELKVPELAPLFISFGLGFGFGFGLGFGLGFVTVPFEVLVV